jgi:hypothetical protein
MAKRKQKPESNGLAVSFGNVSAGDKTCRIGCSVDRGTLKLTDADKNLCEKRLAVVCIVRPPGENEDQGRLDGMEREGIHEVQAVADVKSFSATKDTITFGLTFALASVDIGELVKLAKRSGKLRIEGSEPLLEQDRKTAASGEIEEDEE